MKLFLILFPLMLLALCFCIWDGSDYVTYEIIVNDEPTKIKCTLDRLHNSCTDSVNIYNVPGGGILNLKVERR